MKTQGYVIARNRGRDQFFTSSSAYDRPKWIPLAEATVYLTAELAQTAFTKLARNGAYECRIIPVKEAFEFQMPDEAPEEDMGAEPDQMEVDIVSDEDGEMKMVAADQEDPCEVCAHCPCTCDTEEDGVDDLVDAEMAGEEMPSDEVGDLDDLAADELESRMSPEGAALAQRLPAGRRGMAESVMPAKPPLDAVTPGNKTTVLDLKKPETIKYKDPAHTADKPDTDLCNSGAHPHDEKVKVPSEVMSELKACIAEFSKEAEAKNTHDDTRASFCMTVVSAFEQLLQDLELGTVEGVKQAQIHMTSYMNPITAHLPVSVQKFIFMGGRKPTLKDLFDDKRQQQKLDEVSNDMLSRYVKKSDDYVAKATSKRDYKSGDDPKVGKRIDGAMKAVNKMYKAYNPPRNKAAK